jgi:hypothetical protein
MSKVMIMEIEVESYGAFNNHHAFNAAYISLKENKDIAYSPQA